MSHPLNPIYSYRNWCGCYLLWRQGRLENAPRARKSQEMSEKIRKSFAWCSSCRVRCFQSYFVWLVFEQSRVYFWAFHPVPTFWAFHLPSFYLTYILRFCWPFYLACCLAFSLVWVRVQVRYTVPVPTSCGASMHEWREEGSRGIEKGMVREKGHVKHR